MHVPCPFRHNCATYKLWACSLLCLGTVAGLTVMSALAAEDRFEPVGVAASCIAVAVVVMVVSAFISRHALTQLFEEKKKGRAKFGADWLVQTLSDMVNVETGGPTAVFNAVSPQVEVSVM